MEVVTIIKAEYRHLKDDAVNALTIYVLALRDLFLSRP